MSAGQRISSNNANLSEIGGFKDKFRLRRWYVAARAVQTLDRPDLVVEAAVGVLGEVVEQDLGGLEGDPGQAPRRDLVQRREFPRERDGRLRPGTPLNFTST